MANAQESAAPGGEASAFASEGERLTADPRGDKPRERSPRRAGQDRPKQDIERMVQDLIKSNAAMAQAMAQSHAQLQTVVQAMAPTPRRHVLPGQEINEELLCRDSLHHNLHQNNNREGPRQRTGCDQV